MVAQYFLTQLGGKRFKLYVEHQALTNLVGMAAKLARLLSELQQSLFEVNHRRGNILTHVDDVSSLTLHILLD